MSETPLVIDVGMYDGSDTAYYLYRGYRVIAIDANPQMIARAQTRFRDAISTGQLILLNVAIAQNVGSSILYISSRDEGSSTMNRQKLEARGEEVANEIKVPCLPFSDILEKFGSPYYLKIDIEGLDHFCLEAIDPLFPPDYVSWEAGEDAIECLNLMFKKGYTRFKIINQITFYDLPTINSIKYRLQRKLREVFGFSRPLYALNRDWTFLGEHSSGPCCEETSGLWRSFEESVRIWTTFCQQKTAKMALYDFHAALPITKVE